MKHVIIFCLLLAIPICFINCNSDDKLKLELIYKLMEEPDNIDTLVMSSSFYDEKTYSKIYNGSQEKKEIIEYITKYKVFGYSYGGNKIFNVRKMNSNETEKTQYYLITFDNQKIGIIFVFLYDDMNKKWYFENWGAFINTLKYL